MSTELMIFNDNKMNSLYLFADRMATGETCVPVHFRGKSTDCLAICMQAARWEMDPFLVAQKTHLVSGTLGYESQLVNAVISSSKAIKGRFHYETIGDWSVFEPGNKPSEQGLGVRVGAILQGEEEITWGDILYIKNITTRNSPLWRTAPAQQLKYLALKYWSRLYTPDVIMGVYDREELEAIGQPERDITDQVNDLNDSIVQSAAEAEATTSQPAAAKPKAKARAKPTPKTQAQAQDDINKAEGKAPIEGELVNKPTIDEIAAELKEKEVTNIPLNEDASAFNELLVRAQNIANGKDFNTVKDALMSAHKAQLITGAEANQVKAALMSAKTALTSK